MLTGLLELPVWGYIAITLVATHITIAAVTIYLHRAMAHRALDLHPVVSHFFRLWLWLTTGQVTRQWMAVHRKHHAKVETEEDPHSPQVKGINAVLFGGAFLYAEECRKEDTLEQFGKGPTRDSQDPDHVALQLQELLDAEMLRRFGERPLPAVVIQGRRLAHRLRTFARWQAQWRADGWRIHRVEWAPGDTGTVAFPVDDKPFGLRGRIDRIDRHEQPPVDEPFASIDPLLRAAYGQRRKMLRRSLAGMLDEAAIAASGVDPTARPETLDLQDWARLAAQLAR